MTTRGRSRRFTPAAIDELTRGRLCDPEVTGLRMEVTPGGKKTWKYRRHLPGQQRCATMRFGLYPRINIAEAREWARALNEQVEAGLDPRDAAKEAARANSMTVDRAHKLYMVAVREGRSSRAKRVNKPRTIFDKLRIYRSDVAPRLFGRIIYDVTENDLVQLVVRKGKVARIRANRLAAELKVFFGWAASLRGMEVGLKDDPSRRLHDLKFPETPRARQLSLQEIQWFLAALAEEERDYQRGMLMWLLTAARLSEVAEARSSELAGPLWIIPAERTKNGVERRIALGPWGRSLMQSDGEWTFPAPIRDGPRSRDTWHKALRRVRKRMERIAGGPIERFTPHDLRRTMRSNTKRLRIDYETAEAMLNHVKKGLERTYDRYELEDEKRASFLCWEMEVIRLARLAGVPEALGVPDAGPPVSHDHQSTQRVPCDHREMTAAAHVAAT